MATIRLSCGSCRQYGLFAEASRAQPNLCANDRQEAVHVQCTAENRPIHRPTFRDDSMKTRYLKLLGLLLIAVVTTGCVSSIPFQEQLPQPAYGTDAKVLITVIDERRRIQQGKPRDFIGVAHGSFGIPFDWSVKQALNVAEGDQKRDLSAFIEYRLTNGLQQKGWNAQALQLDRLPSEQEAQALLEQNQADTLLALRLNEWYFSLNLNWVSAFNFDTDTDVRVFKKQQGQVLEKNFSERDVIEEKSSESPQNNILRAYRDQLRQIVDDPEVRNTLARQQ